jgi:hypothetical protein
MPNCCTIEFLVLVPVQCIESILCAMPLVAVDNDTLLGKPCPLLSFILRKLLVGTLFNDTKRTKD